MSKQLTPTSSLETFRREAKRWLKALRANDPDARARLVRALPPPNTPAEPGLRDVQLALAREYGFAGWTELRDALAARAATGADLQQSGLVALLTAAGKGDVPRLTELLDEHPELINQRGALGQSGLRTALHFGSGHESVVRLLLERGADPNIRDEGDDAYPLHFAAERGDMNVVRLLIEHGADPNGDGTDHELSVLGWATCFDYAYHRDVADYLLAHGANHDIVTAVAMGDARAIRDIVARSRAALEKPMDRTNRRRRPLHLAVVKKRRDALATLLELGADPNSADAAGLTPLDQAALDGEREMAQLLIDRGARIELPSAVALERTGDVERLLREDPQCLRPGNRWGTVIVRAAERGSGKIIDMLVHRGASVNVRDDTQTSVDQAGGYTALHAAAFNGNASAVTALLSHGADVRARDAKYCGTPAGWARYAGHQDAAHLILAGPIDVFDAIDNDRKDRLHDIVGRDPEAVNRPFGAYAECESRPDQWWPDGACTPLLWTVLKNKIESTRVLVELGADTAVRDKQGRSLVDIARETGGPELVAVLRGDNRAAVGRNERAQLVARFLRSAAPDWRMGGPDGASARHTADRLLRQHPDFARDSIFTAAVCGNLAEVERILRERPEAATEPGGPRGWPPLLYLCNARLSHPAATENAVAITRALLDRGADPNAYYQGGNPQIHYTALTGVMGDGEEHAACHPQARELAQLLMERGAEPYDGQVMYNTHFQGPPVWLLDLMYEHSIRRGRKADWEDPEWRMLDQGGYGWGARYLLTNAMNRTDRAVFEWCLEHGASPNPSPARGSPWWRAPQTSLYEEARRRGLSEFAELLVRHGAPRTDVKLTESEAFVAAAMQLDRAEAERMLKVRPELLRDPTAMHVAAKLDRVDVIALLLELGMSPNIEDPEHPGKTPLHEAAYANAARAATLLLERGADPNIRDSKYGGTPLGWAVHGSQSKTIEVLRHVSRDVWHLVFTGTVERLREVLKGEPELAKTADEDGSTLLMWLPEDEASAVEVVRVLLAYGVDPAARNGKGQTAADSARARGLTAAADLLAG